MQLSAEEIRVAAASNLRYVLPELAEAFEKQTGHKLAISFAASGTLTTQIQHGAPFEVFLSADPHYIERLIEAEFTEGSAVDYAEAQLALFAAKHSSLNVDDGMAGLKIALEQGNITRIAIANPRHAPYGQAAQKELEELGIWQQIQPYLLVAENASQAIQFCLSSSVDAGIVAYGHVIQAAIAEKGSYIKLDTTLQQQAILVRGASESAKQFINFIQQQSAKTILLQYGFL